MMRFGSICSGIEAASVAWHPLGWRAAFLAEIDPFPRAVLKHRWPDVPLHGDFTTIRAGEYGAIDLLVGGTPCQSFSVAGLRGGLDDERGNLALEYLRLADRLRPRWLVWENVPGVLSSNGGRDFGAILGGMVELGYGFGYRVLDAQFFGIPQRRRRVFVVGHLGDWRPAVAVLFERHSLQGHSAPRREAREAVADSLEASLGRRNGQPSCGSRVGHLQTAPTLRSGGSRTGGDRPPGTDVDTVESLISYGGNNTSGPIELATACNGMHGRLDFETETFVAYRTSPNCGAWETGDRTDALTTGTDRTSHVVAFDTTQITHPENRCQPKVGDPCHPLAAGAHAPAIAFEPRERGDDGRGYGRPPNFMEGVSPALNTVKTPAVAFQTRGSNLGLSQDMTGTIGSNADRASGSAPMIAAAAVRRLTPRECERLQGFPDNYTAIPWRGGMAPDGPRYRALGNSMAVPVMRWIGERIAAVEELQSAERAA